MAKAMAKASWPRLQQGYNRGDFQSPPDVVVVVAMMWATLGNIGLHYNGDASCDLQATSRMV